KQRMRPPTQGRRTQPRTTSSTVCCSSSHRITFKPVKLSPATLNRNCQAASAKTRRMASEIGPLSGHSVAPKPAAQDDGGDHPCELGNNESRPPGRRDPRKGIGQRAGNGDGGIGKRCRSREPIGRRDVEPNGVRNGLRPPRDAAEDGQQKAEGRDSFREPLSR